jgi:hypothetical protein
VTANNSAASAHPKASELKNSGAFLCGFDALKHSHALDMGGVRKHIDHTCT